MSHVYEFAKEYEKLDYENFITKAAVCASALETKDDVLHFIYLLEHALKTKTIEPCEELTKLCLSLRSKIYDILIAKGDMFENNVIFLYAYFSKCELPEDVRIGAYEKFVDGNLYSDGVGDVERVFLITLRFFASFANSKPYALEKFFMSISLLHYVEVSNLDLDVTIRSFFGDCKIDTDTISNILKKLYAKEFFLSVTPTQRRSILNWSFYCLWLVELYLNHPFWSSLYPLWKDLLFEHIKRDECDEAMYLHFFIYHFMGNRFQTQEEWRAFNEEMDAPMSAYYKDFGNRIGLVKCKPTQSEGKKIIGFVLDRLVENSPFKVAYSLWKSLYEREEFRDKYEIRIYVMSYFEKNYNSANCISMINEIKISVFDAASPFYKDINYHSHLSKAIYLRQKMIDDGVDIMIHGSSYDISDFLVATRTAPKQIYWSHGNAMFDVEEMDLMISHCNLKGANYRHFEMPMDLMFLNPEIESTKIIAERAKYPKDAFLLGTIGRLVKLESDEYLEAVAQIMKQNPNTIYIAAGPGNTDYITSKIEELGVKDRFYMPGFVDPHIYGHIIDLWLNTFPHTQGQSTQEFESKGGAAITLNSKWIFRTDSKEYESVKQYYIDYFNSAEVLKYRKSLNIGDNDIEWNTHSPIEFGVAESIEAYINKATMVIQHKDLAVKMGNLNKLFCYVSTQEGISTNIALKFSTLISD